MVAELFPLHGLVAIDINFFKEVNQREGYFMFEFLVLLVVVKML